MLYQCHIFCDFDGTISGHDIGWEMFQRFGEQEPWNAQMIAGIISASEYWQKMAQELTQPITQELLDAFLQTIPIDSGFQPLLAVASEHSIPFTIVSDGFDIYIHRFLELHGIRGVDVFCNHAELTAEGGMTVSFPHATEGCDCLTATCKRNVVLGLAHPDARIIYVGDGISDHCPAEHADIVFAKGKLAAWCNANRIPHYPFSRLEDVAQQLSKILERRRLRPRHQAVLQRKAAWERE
ncbi:MAG: MtnX-like HAD-IB family phosphatase [Armatimonadetes bacterium]|nr:MtnX-like HAD-IB family phosphatase [Armatimonadota bacterium]